MAELVDVQDLGSCGAIRVGSTPTTRTITNNLHFIEKVRRSSDPFNVFHLWDTYDYLKESSYVFT